MYFLHSEITKNSLEKILPQLKCNFTWNLLSDGTVPCHLEDRVRNQIEFLNTKFRGTMYNLLAYIKHLEGDNGAALKCLQQAEALDQQQDTAQAEIRRMVTWGNYAWVYYHMGQFSEAQTYIDKVKHICEKFSNPYSIDCPELDSEEGWTRLKCGRNERAKMCFEKALDEQPNNPEFSTGLALAMCHLDDKPQKQFAVEALKQAIELSPENQYVKVLLALKLQKMKEEREGKQLLEDALLKAPHQPDVLRNAATFYRREGNLDKVIELLLRAVECSSNNGHFYYQIMCCFREKVKQMQNTEESEDTGNRRKVEKVRKLVLDYIKKAGEKRLSPMNAPFDLTEFLEAEECYQRACSKELPKPADSVSVL
jgi:tetratricopeptide (TPR) repeat protein